MTIESALPARGARALTAPVLRWYAHAARDLPWRRAGTPAWDVLVSEIMLQQTPVARVLPAWAAWLARWPTAADLAADSSGEAVRMWGRLGYPRRALRLHACAREIVERYDGAVPSDVLDLESLPGVGSYTARAVAAFAFGQRQPVVDTNVRRVVARALHGRAEPGPPSARRDQADVAALLPADPARAALFSVALMELGALVCVARKPRCPNCPLAAACAWNLAGRPAHDGPRAARQPAFAGTDRQVRGLIMATLRDANGTVERTVIDAVWPDAEQRNRALASLLSDGLAVEHGTGYALPAH